MAPDPTHQQQPLLSPEERAELRQYFALPPNSSLNELSRVYRCKAREFHPDLNPGAEAEFSQLSANYQRAGELLARAVSG